MSANDYNDGMRDEAIKSLKERTTRLETLLNRVMLATIAALLSQAIEFVKSGVQ